MEWVTSLRAAIDYMEAHLLEEIHAEEVAASVFLSPFYLQKGFKLLTGYSIGEYIRCRRLYLAALEAITGRERIVDLAFRYGYETPESFTKAFTRFHGISPAQIRGKPSQIRTFLPLKIKIFIQGGNEMDYTVERMAGFSVIGFERSISFDSAYQEIPKFWEEFAARYLQPFSVGSQLDSAIKQMISDYRIGEYGICLEDKKETGKFRYLIAGRYQGTSVPEGVILYEFPELTWAKFHCSGSLPGALQSVNTRIFNEWLPGNTNYQLAMEANVEWYSDGDMTAPDYECGIWLPVTKKG